MAMVIFLVMNNDYVCNDYDGDDDDDL